MLPKKGSRRIDVGGVVYRWRESHGRHAFELRLELFASPGAMLVVEFPYRHLDAESPNHVYRPVMTKRLLTDVIAYGTAHGWLPAKAGPAVAIAIADAATLVSDYDYRYSK